MAILPESFEYSIWIRLFRVVVGGELQNNLMNPKYFTDLFSLIVSLSVHDPLNQSALLPADVALVSQMHFFHSEVPLIPSFGNPLIDPQAQQPHE